MKVAYCCEQLDQDTAGFAGLQIWFQALSLSDQGYIQVKLMHNGLAMHQIQRSVDGNSDNTDQIEACVVAVV